MVPLKTAFNAMLRMIVGLTIMVVVASSSLDFYRKVFHDNWQHSIVSVTLNKAVYAPDELMRVSGIVTRTMPQECILNVARFVIAEDRTIMWSQVVPGAVPNDTKGKPQHVASTVQPLNLRPGKYTFRTEARNDCPPGVGMAIIPAPEVPFEVRAP